MVPTICSVRPHKRAVPLPSCPWSRDFLLPLGKSHPPLPLEVGWARCLDLACGN